MVASGQSVFLFIGRDKYLKEKALNDLVLSLPGKPLNRSDQNIFHSADLDAHEVFDRLNTMPLLSDKRFIVIKGIEDVTAGFRARLIEYIRKPSKFTYLVLDAQDDVVLRDYGEVISNIDIRRFDIPSGASLGSWINNYINSNYKIIEPAALAMLKELDGNDLSYVLQELDKLILFVGSRKEIRAHDVEDVIGKSLVVSAFEIADAIGRRDTVKALKIALSLIAGGRKAHEIIGVLCWHLRRMLKAKRLKGKLESDYAIASRLKISRKFQDDFFRQLADFSREKIGSDIELLLKADLDMKLSKFNPNTILELALIRLCVL